MIRRWITGLDRRAVLVVGVALVVRVAFAAWASRGAPVTVVGDQQSYWRIGHSIAAGHGYVAPTTGAPSAYYPVGWPAMIAAVVWALRLVHLQRFDVTGVIAMQIALGVCTVALVWVIARRVAGRRVATIAAWIVALLPSLVASSAGFAVESAFTAAYLAAMLPMVLHDWSTGLPSWRRTVVFGVGVGVAAQIRPFALPLLLGLVVAGMMLGLGARRTVVSFLLAFGCCALVFVPWTVRNAVRLHAFVPSSTNLGDTLCMARFPGSTGGFSFADHVYCADPTLPDVQRNTANVKGALTFVRDHPVEELRLVWRRFVLIWRNDHITLDEVVNNWGAIEPSTQRIPGWSLAADIAYWMMLPAAVPGAILLARRRRDAVGLMWVALAAGALFVIPLGLWGTVRFHMPLLPLLAVASATAADAAMAAWSSRRRRA